MEKIFGVSRTPVRNGLKQLENDGYIYRVQGKGTFVANRKPREAWTTMSGFRNQYSSDWEKISVRTFEIKEVIDPYYSRLLQLDESEKLVFLKRIRYLNNQPIFYLEHYIRPVLPIETYEKDNTFSTVEELLKEEIGIDYTEVEDEIEAVIVEPYIGGALQIPSNSAVLKGTRISYIENKVPIEVNNFYIKTDNWKYYTHYKY